MKNLLGRPVRRREDAALLTGRGRFVEDLNVPGAVYLTLVRSPYAKARVTRVDTSAAASSPGVLQRSEEHTSELQSQSNLVCRLLLEKKKTTPRPSCGASACSWAPTRCSTSPTRSTA